MSACVCVVPMVTARLVISMYYSGKVMHAFQSRRSILAGGWAERRVCFADFFASFGVSFPLTSAPLKAATQWAAGLAAPELPDSSECLILDPFFHCNNTRAVGSSLRTRLKAECRFYRVSSPDKLFIFCVSFRPLITQSEVISFQTFLIVKLQRFGEKDVNMFLVRMSGSRHYK